MGRVIHGIERGIRLTGVNGDTGVDVLFGSAAPGGDTGDQDDAPIGSLYMRVNGANSTIYQKIANAGSTADWQENGSSAAVIGTWRPEKVRALTNDVITVGVNDPTGWADNDGAVDGNDFAVGEFAISDADGTPALLEVTAVGGATSVTFAAAANAILENDTFLAINYLPDPVNQEGHAIVNKTATVMIKIADVNWEFATGINLSGSYSAANGSITSADTVESAIEKLDGNQQDIQSASGLSQGDVNYGTFTGDLLADAQTSKQLFQRVEDLLSQLKGVEVTGLTTLADVDTVPTATVKACHWHIMAFEEATPANIVAREVYAVNDGTNVVDTVYSKLKLGSGTIINLTVDVSGGNMRLRASSGTAGITIVARRIEVIKSTL